GMSTIQPKNYAFMTLLPAGDGDVHDNNGAQFYDQADPGPFKSQLYVHYTNHEFYNRQWLDDDSLWTPPQPAVMARPDHEPLTAARYSGPPCSGTTPRPTWPVINFRAAS